MFYIDIVNKFDVNTASKQCTKKTKRRVESESLNVEIESAGTADKDAFALGLEIAKTKL